MGSDPESVVDETLRVRGVGNLRIADASVIPIIPNGNVHTTITAIAFLAADIILSNKM
jgi:choline dehydrogenase